MSFAGYDVCRLMMVFGCRYMMFVLLWRLSPIMTFVAVFIFLPNGWCTVAAISPSLLPSTTTATASSVPRSLFLSYSSPYSVQLFCLSFILLFKLEQNFGFSNKEGLPDSQTMLFRPQPLTREATSLLTNASRLMSLFCVKIRSAPGWTTCVICFTLQRDIVGHRYF